jgi:beta-lactamase class A
MRLLSLTASMTLLFMTPAAVSPAGQPAAQLRDEVVRIAALSKAAVGVAALNLATGTSIEVNADQRFKMASTFKVPVAAFALHLADEGRVSLTDPIPVRREDMLEPGVLFDYFRHPGVAISMLNAIELSITVSDNGATDIILGRVGGAPAVNAWLAARGYAEMNVGSRSVRETFGASGSQGAAGGPEATELDRTTTPRALVRFLSDLHEGRLVSRERTTTLLDVMRRTAGERISLHLPPGTDVRHKTGTLFGAGGISVNDVGYIRLPNGQSLALGVFIKDSPESVSHATRDKVIGHIARAIYDHFQLGLPQ